MLTDSFKYDNLLAGDFPRVSATGIVASGVSLQRGAVLGKITEGGKLALCDKTAEDGSEAPYAVLAADVDATEADAVAPIFLSGHFNAAALSYADGTVAADVADKARELGIYIA